MALHSGASKVLGGTLKPWWRHFENLSKDWAILFVSSWQKAGAHQELANDLATGELEVCFEELYPFRFVPGMVRL